MQRDRPLSSLMMGDRCSDTLIWAIVTLDRLNRYNACLERDRVCGAAEAMKECDTTVKSEL